MTLIVMLILAGISLSGLIGEKGLFKRTEDASSKYNEAKAREVLETVLLADAQFEKQTNLKYNQEEFLDELIKKEIEEAEVEGDIVKVGEWWFELDRSVPKIGKNSGRNDKLIIPKVILTKPNSSSDNLSATFDITATVEGEQKIKKIEIWLLGEKIDEFNETNGINGTKSTETITSYEVYRNGKYTVKAYAELTGSARTEITEIVPAVTFMPESNKNWQRTHKATVKVKNGEKVGEIKYAWSKSKSIAPNDTEFENNMCRDGEQIIGKGYTGIYYLWVSVSMGEKNRKCVSGEFWFDNTAPTVQNTSYRTVYTDDMIEMHLEVTAYNQESDIKSYSFEYKRPTSSEWSTPHVIFTSDSHCNFIASPIEGGKSYDIRITLTDVVGNSSVFTEVYQSDMRLVENGKYFIAPTEISSNIGSEFRYKGCLATLSGDDNIMNRGETMKVRWELSDLEKPFSELTYYYDYFMSSSNESSSNTFVGQMIVKTSSGQVLLDVSESETFGPRTSGGGLLFEGKYKNEKGAQGLIIEIIAKNSSGAKRLMRGMISRLNLTF